MLEQSNELAAWDRDHFFHPSTHMGMHARGESPTRVMAGGEGVTVWDNNGKKSIDAFAGLYCVNVGYGRQKIADAIAAQAKQPGLLPRLCRAWHGCLDPARQDDHRPGPPGHVAGLFRPVRLGRQRDEHQADLVLQQRARPAGEEEDHLALARLSRVGRHDRVPDRTRPFPQRLRPAAPTRPAHRGALLFPPRRPLDERGAILQALRRPARGDDPRRRAGYRRRLHRRADTGHRRHRAAAGRLLADDPGRAQEVRHPARRRRGGDGLRKARHDVRLGPLRHRAGPDHHRQGTDLRLRAAVGRHRRRRRCGRCW